MNNHEKAQDFFNAVFYVFCYLVELSEKKAKTEDLEAYLNKHAQNTRQFTFAVKILGVFQDVD